MANITTERAEPNSWPWQAQIKILTNNRPHHCSGVLIQRQWVLTAAACFDNNKKKNAYRVMLGDHDLTRYIFDLQVHLFFINNQKFKQSPRKSLIC